MKSIILLAIAIFTIVLTSRAHAVDLPNWERPVFHADRMTVKQAKGEFVNAREVSMTMTRRDGSKQATGLIVKIDGRDFVLQVKEARIGECGSTEIVAVSAPHFQIAGTARTKLLLVDHSTRICKDLKEYQWEAKLVYSERVGSADFEIPSVALGQIIFVGQPKPVMTTMSDKDQGGADNSWGDNDGITGGILYGNF